ncbi:DeoR/GlpR family DNA-binding transcription regulator [Pseudothermotoga sp.]
MKDVRLQKILSFLKVNGFGTVEELAKEVGASVITIRRDLSLLEKQGLVVRKRGGALLKNLQGDVPFFEKLERNKLQKVAIAKEAVKFLKNGQTIFATGGSTVYYTIQAISDLPLGELTVVTNSITTAWAVVNLPKRLTLIHTGGTVRENSFECIGSHAKSLVEAINVDLFLMGVDGVDHEGGISFSSFEECLIAKEVFKRSKTNVVVADSSKFGIVAPYKVCELDCVDYIVTNSAPSVDNLLRKAKLSRVTVVRVEVSEEE